MPILILLGVAAIYGTAAIINKIKPSHPPANTSDERTKQVMENNQKRIDKIMRKYR